MEAPGILALLMLMPKLGGTIRDDLSMVQLNWAASMGCMTSPLINKMMCFCKRKSKIGTGDLQVASSKEEPFIICA